MSKKLFGLLGIIFYFGTAVPECTAPCREKFDDTQELRGHIGTAHIEFMGNTDDNIECYKCTYKGEYCCYLLVGKEQRDAHINEHIYAHLMRKRVTRFLLGIRTV